MKPNKYILPCAMFVAAVMAAAPSAKAQSNHRHAGFTQRHHDHRRKTTPAA